MTVMRKKIAEHMVLSTQTSAHVLLGLRGELRPHRRSFARAKKAEYEARRREADLSRRSSPRSIVDALRQFPIVNASIDGDNIVYKKDINLGIAVALDYGPDRAGDQATPTRRTCSDLSRAISDLAARARSKKLKPDEVQGGTFTITNPGLFGALFGLPIINQPQVAILGVGAIEKRAVVIDDAIAIRPMAT